MLNTAHSAQQTGQRVGPAPADDNDPEAVGARSHARNQIGSTCHRFRVGDIGREVRDGAVVIKEYRQPLTGGQPGKQTCGQRIGGSQSI